MISRVKAIINKEIEEKSGHLDLHSCGLTVWPEEIFEMTWLRVLNFGNIYEWDG